MGEGGGHQPGGVLTAARGGCTEVSMSCYTGPDFGG